MLPTRSQNQLFIQQKVSFHGCDVGRLGWEISAQPGMLARGRLGPGALTMLIKTCDKFMSSAQTTDCPGAHPGPWRLLCSSPSALALTIPARFGTAPQRIQHLLTWAWLEVQPLETAKMPEKYKKCLTKHLRVGVLRYGGRIPPRSRVIHPNTQTQALP